MAFVSARFLWARRPSIFQPLALGTSTANTFGCSSRTLTLASPLIREAPLPPLLPHGWAGWVQVGEQFRQRLTEIMEEAFLWAVPKKKTTHSKKRMRSSNKALKDRRDIETCPACGRNKLHHHMCLYCYRDLKRSYRLKKEEMGLH
ncbi:hypothetical protein H4R34_003766 [Dimargaris verticillata]|uniref:Large ribosomal subunit protein bL32m n=1 Tax=Dimargaris verticillata TaxID=2761393 RepID=A0A9W8B039_9FUNG|nr:hypothetical protein H4R34_003766 [Dimargaris verticillata]